MQKLPSRQKLMTTMLNSINQSKNYLKDKLYGKKGNLQLTEAKYICIQ